MRVLPLPCRMLELHRGNEAKVHSSESREVRTIISKLFSVTKALLIFISDRLLFAMSKTLGQDADQWTQSGQRRGLVQVWHHFQGIAEVSPTSQLTIIP